MRNFPLFRYAFYYGPGELDALTGYDLAILQAEHYTVGQIDWLRRAGTRCVAYLSVGEVGLDHLLPEWCYRDPGRGFPAVDERWNTAFVDCRAIAWQDHLVHEVAPPILAKGFDGFFLDTLDVQERYPETRPGVITLVERLHLAAPHAILIANRGFSVLEAILPLIDAVVFEAFTSYCKAGTYAAWDGNDLLWTEQQAMILRTCCADRPVLALDYAAPEDTALQLQARERARSHGFYSFVGPSGLDWLPCDIDTTP